MLALNQHNFIAYLFSVVLLLLRISLSDDSLNLEDLLMLRVH